MAYISDNGAKGFEMSLQWKGFKDFVDLLDQIEDDFGEKDANKILRNACRASMTPVLKAARNNLLINGDVDTGQLLASLQVEARTPTARDKRSIYSTQTMVMISRVTVAPGRKFVSDNDATNKKRLLSKQFKNKKTGVKQHMHSDARAFAIEFGTSRWLPGEGRPFLRPALENNSQLVTDSLGTELGKALIKYRSKTMKV